MIRRLAPVPPLTTSLQKLLRPVGLVTAAWLSACDAPPPPDLPPLPPRVERAAAPAPGEARPLREVTLAVTGEVRGEIQPCGCPTVPYGGFARRLRALDAIRAEGAPVIVLDAGEMLVKGEAVAEAADRRERARVVLDLARDVGLDAWTPAPLDLLPGGLPLLGGSGALAATWTVDGAPALPAATVIERGGVRVGVIGVAAPVRAEAPGVTAVDPVAAARGAMAGREADVWVALSNAGADVERAVAEGVPGLGIVVALRGAELDAPRATAGAPIVEVPDRGRFVTVVRAFLGSTPGPLTVTEDAPWRVYGEERKRVAALSGTAREAGTSVVERLRGEVAAASAGRNLAWVEARPLGSELDGPSALDARIAAFKGETIERAEVRVEAPTAVGYATAGSCSSCHRARFAQWLGDPHRTAWEALGPRKAGFDPECVGCHSTGFGEPGGFATLTAAALANWKSVQCEACHGPLAGHPGNPAAVPRPVTEATCTRCHDRANSPAFDYARYLARISCSVVSRTEAGASGGAPTTVPVPPPAP